MVPIRLSNDRGDEYLMSHLGDKTELDTEPAGENRRGAGETTPIRCGP